MLKNPFRNFRKKFNGKQFVLRWVEKNKTQAERFANIERKRGFSVRITKEQKGSKRLYPIWVRHEKKR